jgi:uncharacterized protein with GYD domain
MATFLYEVSYTPEAWGTQIQHPANRLDAIRPGIEQLGGKIVCGYYMFGDYDLMVIVEGLDNARAASFSIAASAGGAVKAIKTTPLMTIDEGISAMQQAAGSVYRPPS